MIFSIVRPAQANSVSDEQYYYEQIEELANEYGYDVEFPSDSSTLTNNITNSYEYSPSFTLDQLEIILSDLQDLIERETTYNTIDLSSNFNNARITTYTKHYTDVYTQIAILDLYNLACESSADYTYMFFQGLPRFTKVENIDIHYVYLNFVEWIQTGTRYNIFPLAEFGDSTVEIVSEGYNRIDCSVNMAVFSIPIILTGENTIHTYALQANVIKDAI